MLEHIRQQALRQYRQARAAAAVTGRIPGEQLRAMADNIGLWQAHSAAKGDEATVDHTLAARIRSDGRDATALALLDQFEALRGTVEAREGIRLPERIEFSQAGAALDALQRRGARRTVRILRRWMEWQAAMSERVDGRVTRRPAVAPQKPGDDFGGYPDPSFDGLSCEDSTLLLDGLWLMVAVLAWLAIPAVDALVVLIAGAQLAKDAYCAESEC